MQIKTKASNGMAYTGTVAQNAKDGTLPGSLDLKFSPTPGTVATTKFFTSGLATAEVEAVQLGVDGLKMTLLSGVSPKDHIAVTSLEYLHKSATLTASLDMLKKTAGLTATAGSSVATVGVDAQYDSAAKEVTKCDVVLNYNDGGESEAQVATMNKGEAAKFTYSHAIRPDFSVVGEFLYERSGAEAKMCTIGAKYVVDRQTTLKTKVSSDGMMSASYIHRIRPHTTLVLSHRLDVNDMDLSSRKIGLSLVIE